MKYLKQGLTFDKQRWQKPPATCRVSPHNHGTSSAPQFCTFEYHQPTRHYDLTLAKFDWETYNFIAEHVETIHEVFFGCVARSDWPLHGIVLVVLVEASSNQHTINKHTRIFVPISKSTVYTKGLTPHMSKCVKCA